MRGRRRRGLRLAEMCADSGGRDVRGAQQLQNASENLLTANDKDEETRALPAGVYGLEYHAGRRRKRQLVYRLERRTKEVEGALRRHGPEPLRVLVDVGTADALMLEKLRERLGAFTYLGTDLSLDLLRAHPVDGVWKCQADALLMPVKSGVADAVIATAVIEHVADASAMLNECGRLLRSGGILVLTTPDPRMERIASAIRLLRNAGHQRTFKLDELCQLVQACGCEILEARKFMFSPIGFPAEEHVERLLTLAGLTGMLANQLVVARRC